MCPRVLVAVMVEEALKEAVAVLVEAQAVMVAKAVMEVEAQVAR